ncbi:hypothetical protein ACH4E8_29340 [Streptomyces sp. NPDC017979]|uniref:hypothetical protein n=1 Tax=Streptomyces sp. NPDC017979 TaxID=3365024 RepID=UPI00379E5476
MKLTPIPAEADALPASQRWPACTCGQSVCPDRPAPDNDSSDSATLTALRARTREVNRAPRRWPA